MAPVATYKPRIVSLDQFRGYTVAGMCLVNFLAPFAAVPALLKHNESWFSYADSIMPSFFFCVGFSFRLTYLRRRATTTRLQTARTYIRRSLVLFALSFAIYGLSTDWSRWADTSTMPQEFYADRPLPSPTRSFEPLLARARQISADQDPRAVRRSAAQIGALIDAAQTMDSEARKDRTAAQEGARIAEEEADPYLASAIDRVQAWQALDATGRQLVRWKIQTARLFKAELWETLAMIAAAQLLVLPWVGLGSLARFMVLIAYGVGHLVLCAWFNWDFVYGINHNWMSQVWMTGDCRSWDGGIFGPLSWAVAILAGTLAYDLAAGAPSRGVSARRLFAFGAAFAIFGYSLSCLARFYDLDGPELAAIREAHCRQDAERAWLDQLVSHQEHRLKQGELSRSDRIAAEARIAVLRDQKDAYPDLAFAPNPFAPLWSQHSLVREWAEPSLTLRLRKEDARHYSQERSRSLTDLLAEPPFVAPPQDEPQSGDPTIEHRLWNYWMLGKRVPTLSFMTLASGVAAILYSLFIIACDGFAVRLGVFRTFGTNALIAYFIHGAMTLALWPFVPKDKGIAVALTAFAVFFTATYLLVRQLEKRNIYIKL
jgi:predicted acyltransferase